MRPTLKIETPDETPRPVRKEAIQRIAKKVYEWSADLNQTEPMDDGVSADA